MRFYSGEIVSLVAVELLADNRNKIIINIYEEQ